MMEQVQKVGGLYSANVGSTHSVASGAALRENATLPAGAEADSQATPEKTPPPQLFYKKRWFIISQIIIIPLGIALLFIILFPVLRAIVELVVKRTNLDVQSAIITQPSNNTFALELEGFVYNTGIVNAKIKFTEVTHVAWVEDDTETPLGYMQLSELSTKNKRAIINDTTQFFITDEDAFSRFSSKMITAQNFTWRLTSYNLRVQALKFPVAKGITFDKFVTINGFNNFDGNVILKDFQLPGDDPDGGIRFIAVTELNNPSPFALDLGTVVFALSYEGVHLGLGTGTNTNVAPGNNAITLRGTLVPQQDTNLASVSRLFTNYLNGECSPVIATGRSTLQADGSAISWLSQGLQDLHLNVPFKSFVAIDPILTIEIGNFDLAFDRDNAWSPSVESNSVQASLELPFGFGMAISEIQNDLVIMKDGQPVAGLSTPLGASTSSISVQSESRTSGTINITIKDTRLSCPEAQRSTFEAFNKDLTNSDVAEFRLVGAARAVANMGIGKITLDPIKINVTSHLDGLQGLKGMTTINSVDVAGGTSEGIKLDISVTIFNPSNLKLAVGDLKLQLLRQDVVLGTTVLPNLTLIGGNNTINATSIFQASASPEGIQTLNDFVGKKDVQLVISGFDESTEIASLGPAFESLQLEVTLPALKTNLLESASLKVLTTTGKSNNVSHVTVFLSNPFSAALGIKKISSQVSSFGILLGTIEQEVDFGTTPKSTTESPVLNLDMNFNPEALFTLTRALAAESGMDTSALDSIVELGGYQYLPILERRSNERRQNNVFNNFDLPSFVATAFKQLKSDVQLSTDLQIGDYKTTLQLSQPGIPTATDESLSLILPILAAPIVQKIVDESVLGIETVLIVNPEQGSFQTKLKGSITNAGPFNAKISFPSGLTISWGGKVIGRIGMSDISVVGDVGADIDAELRFEVLDVAQLTEFTKALLTEETFDWDISGDNLTGISVTGVAFSSRRVCLKGFNGLKDGVKVEKFDLPSDHPSGGISLTLETMVNNPSQVGIQMSSISFDTYMGDVLIAPVASTGTVTLSAQSTSQLSLAGQLIPQESPEGLAAVSNVFNKFIHGEDSNVSVRGSGAGSSHVTWLNEGIKSLVISTILPNQGPLDIIKSINLNELTLMFTSQSSFNPSTSSKSTDAAFSLPFAFPIDIVALEQEITLGYEGTDFGKLDIPKGSTTTDVRNRVIHLTFNDVPLSVSNDRRSTFSQFLAATTLESSQTVHLSGSANVDASTAVGMLELSGITFSLDSSIAGLQGLSSKPTVVSNLDVHHGYPDYLLIKAGSSLFNPSNLTIGTSDVSFDFRFQDQVIGTADISNMVIRPGEEIYPIDVHFSPKGGAVGAGRALLENYLQGIDSVSAIAGSTDSTSVESLKLALSQIDISPVAIPAIHQNLIQSASLSFPLDIVKTGVASTSFKLANPFTASINLLKLSAKAKFHGVTLGTIPVIDASSHPIHAPGHGDVTSPGLPLLFNLDPTAIIQLLLVTSQQNGVDLGPLVQMFQFVLQNPDFKPPVTTSVDTKAPTCKSGNQFDAGAAILRSLAGLEVDLEVDSSVKLDDFPTNLSFIQSGVPAEVDTTVLYLIGAVAGPVAQHLVDGSILAFESADITNISNDGFDLTLKGSLTNTGPLDASIVFTEPLNVNWQGHDIAKIELPSVCAAANIGVPDYQTKARLTITDQFQFAEFATFLLHSESFEWTISSPKLSLTALGTIFENVSFGKTVSFKAFNGLPGLSISNFQLPSDDPAGGIQMETDATIPSPAQIGIDLGSVTFRSFFEGTFVGPLSANNLILGANSVTETHLSGRMVPQSGADLDVMGKLFSQYLDGQNITIQTTGESVQPTGSSESIGWLSNAFKTLTFDVILTGDKAKVIEAVQLNDLQVTLKSADQAFKPPTSSSNTVAKYKNPFGFSLQVVEVGQTIALGSGGHQIAQLAWQVAAEKAEANMFAHL
ncbi:hypothetical protein CPC08DRAFT_361960 [Agrocybe pediades]|nr:hypothetical protein CPC08DRAFT_361960 [Agrocybe pediades]